MHNSDFGKQTTRRPQVAAVNKFSFRQYSCNPKQDQLQGERISEVERENRILFDRISNILKGKPHKSNLTYANDKKLPFTSNLRRFKSKIKDHNPFGLPPDKTRDLLAQLTKERYDKLVERDLATAEISEKLPALTKRMPRSHNTIKGHSETLDIESHHIRSGKGSLQPSYRQHTINSQDKSFSLERADVNQTFVERSHRTEDHEKYRALNISDIGPDREYHQLAPTKLNTHKFRTIQTKDNSYYTGKVANDEPFRHEHTPLTPERYDKPTVLHRKAYRLQGQNYLIEIEELAGSLSITAFNNDKNSALVKRISKDRSLSVLHEYKYDFDNLCSNLVIQNNNISLASTNIDTPAHHKGRSNGNHSLVNGHDESVDEHYNEYVQKPSKPKVERIITQKAKLPVSEGLFDKLSRSRLSPMRPLATQEPTSSGIRSASYNSKAPDRSPIQKATANSQPIIIEYSSYGRKLNEGKGSASALPWGESTAPKIKNHFQEPNQPSKESLHAENPEHRNSQPELPWEDNSSHIFGQRAAQINQSSLEDNSDTQENPAKAINPEEEEKQEPAPLIFTQKYSKEEENVHASTHNTRPDELKEQKDNIIHVSIGNASNYFQEEIYEDDFDKDPASQKITTKSDEISEVGHLNSEEQPSHTKEAKINHKPSIKSDEDDDYIVVLDDSDEEMNDDIRKENEKEEEMKRSKKVVNPFNLTKEAKTEATTIHKTAEDEDFQNNSEPTERYDYEEVRKLLAEKSEPTLVIQEERKVTEAQNKAYTIESSISIERMDLTHGRDPGDVPSFHPSDIDFSPNRLQINSQLSQRTVTKCSRRYSTRNEPDNEDPESKERKDYIQIDTAKVEPDIELNVNSPIKSRTSFDGNPSKILTSKYSMQKQPQNPTEVSNIKDPPVSIKYTDP